MLPKLSVVTNVTNKLDGTDYFCPKLNENDYDYGKETNYQD